MFLEIIYLIYMYKKDLVLHNLQWLICHKTKPNQTDQISSTYLSVFTGTRNAVIYAVSTFPCTLTHQKIDFRVFGKFSRVPAMYTILNFRFHTLLIALLVELKIH